MAGWHKKVDMSQQAYLVFPVNWQECVTPLFVLFFIFTHLSAITGFLQSSFTLEEPFSLMANLRNCISLVQQLSFQVDNDPQHLGCL